MIRASYLAAAALFVVTQPSTAAVVGYFESPDEYREIDPSNGSTTLVSGTGGETLINTIFALDQRNGIAYRRSGSSQLTRTDLTTGLSNTVNIAGPGNLWALGVHDGALVGYFESPNEYREIDPATGSTTFVSGTGGGSLINTIFALDQQNGIAYRRSGSSQLTRTDLTTGVSNTVNIAGPGRLWALGVHNGALVGYFESPNEYREIDPSTGNTTFVCGTGGGSLINTIFALDQQNGIAYRRSGSSQLTRTDLATGLSNTVNIVGSGTLWALGVNNFTIVPDNIPPEFTFVPPKTFGTAPLGTTSAVVDWTPPMAIDESGLPVSIRQIMGAPPGSSFPIGTTTITYTASDAAGNLATSSFEVVVKLNPGDVLAIATTDDAAPGDPNGQNYSGFKGAYLAGPGKVIVEGASSELKALWKGDIHALPLRQLGRVGATPPGASAPLLGFDRWFIDPAGDSVFRARTEGGGGGHWFDDGVAPPAAIALLGAAAVGAGSAYDKFPIRGQALAKPGEYYFLARLSGGGGITKLNNWGIWSNVGGLQIRKGDAVPARPGATYLDFEPQIAANEHRELLFSAAVRGGAVINAIDNRALFAGDPSAPAIVARRGSLAPSGGGAVFDKLSAEAMNKRGSAVFSAVLIGAGVTTSNNTALYTNVGGSVVQIAREGAVATGFGPGVEYDELDEVYISSDDEVIWFKATVRGGSPPVSATENEAVYVFRDGVLALVAQEGGFAPGTGNGVYRALPKLIATSCGHAAFTGILRRGVGGVTRRTAHGIWFVAMGTSSPILLSRSGDTFTLGARTETVKRPDIGETFDDGTAGRSSALGAGNIVTILSYARGHKVGVFLLGLP